MTPPGKPKGRSDSDHELICKLIDNQQRLVSSVRVLAHIADRYDDNALDDEARKFWGKNDEHTNTTPPERIELYSGRGGGELLNLKHCLDARTTLQDLNL